ncbi:DUF930 domain-containing protein [Rhodobacterales bacterium]|nr:DUF930 domain-containing protein [Rhodobacterales bacterium]
MVLALIADMERPAEQAPSDDRRFLLWGLAISIALHVVAALVLMDRISGYEPASQPQAVEVELVPPPEQEEDVPPAVQPEEQVPELPEPPEQPKQQEEATQEETQPAPPPPPPPPPSEEQAAEATEQPPAPTVMQPVEQFGEEDTAPQDAEEGEPAEDAVTDADAQPDDAPGEAGTADDASETEPDPLQEAGQSEDEAAAAPEAEDPEQAPESETAEDQTADAQPSEEPAPEEQTPEEQTPEEQAEEEQVPDETAAEEEPVQTPSSEDGVPLAEEGEPADETFGTVGRIVTSAVPNRKPSPPRASASTSNGQGRQGEGQSSGQSSARRGNLLPARELFSRTLLDEPSAQTAMRGMTPGQRLNLLCMTELRAQISVVSSVPPDMLPSFRPPAGTVLEPRNAAFRSLGRWFNVAFRCETDSEVTRVEKFSFKIGNEIPQSQWGSRGLSGF